MLLPVAPGGSHGVEQDQHGGFGRSLVEIPAEDLLEILDGMNPAPLNGHQTNHNI